MSGVIMLVNEFPPLPVGGAERQAERLSENLAKRGWNVWVLTRSAAGLPKKEERSGFWIIRPASFGPGKLKSLSFVFGSMIEIWKLRKYFEILHAHLAFGPSFSAVIASAMLGKRVIVKLGNSGEFGDIAVSRKSIRGKFRLFVLRRWADAVIVLDETMEKEAADAGFPVSKIIRMKNGIETGVYATQKSKEEYKQELGLSGKIVVLSSGRLSAQKSIDFLLIVFSEALKVNKDLFLLIIGDGPDRPMLEEKANLLNLSAHIRFAGHQNEVRPFLFASDIFVLPSKSEGISNSLLEAMAAGLPCVVSNAGGNAEVLEYGHCGMVLETGSSQDWILALIRLSTSAEKRKSFGERAANRVKEQYDYSVTGHEMENLYFTLTAENTQSSHLKQPDHVRGGRL